MFDRILRSIESIESIVPVLRKLGHAHLSGYKVKPKMFDSMFQAIVATLATAFKEKLTPEIASAWSWLYLLMSDIMLSAHSVCTIRFLLFGAVIEFVSFLLLPCCCCF